MKFLMLTLLPTLLLAAAAGCSGETHQPPQLEEAELTVNFFRSIRDKKSDLAVRQGRQLLALSTDSNHIRQLINIQQSNDAVISAQKLIRTGKINDALKIIRESSAKYSGNHTLTDIYSRLLQLRNAEKLLRSMARARNSSSMRGARIAARAGLSLNMTPQLEKYLSEYEKREAAIAAEEKKLTRQSEKAAQLAAERARQEDLKRQAENKKFAAESAEKIAEGERASKVAGGVD